MFATIGAHFPLLVILCMTLFAATLVGASIEDAVTARRKGY